MLQHKHPSAPAFLILVLAILLTAPTSFGAQSFWADECHYIVNSDGETVSVTTGVNDNNVDVYQWLTSVTIPETVNYYGKTYIVTTIASNAFKYCSKLEMVTLPNTVTSIQGGAFSHSGIRSIVIGDKIEYIGSGAFEYCTYLNSITLPKSIKTIGQNVFQYCTYLSEADIQCEIGAIPFGMFLSCEHLTYIKLPNTVTKIEDSAFNGCSCLINVTLPEYITSIGANAFKDCKAITSIFIPETTTNIGSSSFSGCTSLSEISFPEEISYIGNGAFANTAWFDNQQDGLIYIGKVAYCYKGTIAEGTNITIKEGTTQIAGSAFYNIYTSSGLESITIPNSVVTIGSYAFYNCNNMKNITIGSSVAIIEKGAFSCCNNLEQVNIQNLKNWCNIQFEESKTSNPLYFAHHLFLNGEELKNLVIPENVKSISRGAFIGGSYLTNITFPSSLKSVGSYAFFDCKSITTVALGKNIQSIGTYAFVNCDLLKYVICDRITPPAASNNMFPDNTIIFVDNGCINSYKSNTYWSKYNIQCGTPIYEKSLSYIKIKTSNSEYLTLTQGFANDKKCEAESNIIYIGGLNPGEKYDVKTEYVLVGTKRVSNINIYTDSLIFNEISSDMDICGGKISFTINRDEGLSIDDCGIIINELTFKGTARSTSTKYTISCNTINGLEPNTEYCYVPFVKYNGIYFYGDSTTVKTQSINFTNINCISQLTSTVVSFNINLDDTTDITDCGIVMQNKYYRGTLNRTENLLTVKSDTIDGLSPNNQYEYKCFVKYKDKVYYSANQTLKTKTLTFKDLAESTQTTITPIFRINRDKGLKVDKSGVIMNKIEYLGTIDDATESTYTIACEPITNLSINKEFTFQYFVIIGEDVHYSDIYTIKTKSVGTSTSRASGPTTMRLDATYSAGDARVTDAYFTFNGTKSRNLRLTGLKPKTSYSTTYTVETSTGNQSQSISFTTEALTLTTQAARMLTNTSPMFIATTNIADEETSCGFEWRRYDAPAEMPSATVYCPVYGGTMAGTLKNMAENVYYKFRPFYKAGDGTMYYGDWLAFITADANVEFAPVVYTYSSPEVTTTGATLSGVALRGSSDITSQGFEYWRVGGGSHAAQRAPSSGVTRVTASGERMKVTVSDLSPATTYRFRSFVEAGGVTTYGDEVEFTTDRPSYDVNVDGKVDVGDVNAVLGDILGGGKTATYDVNGDDRVDVGDVNAILADILAK